MRKLVFLVAVPAILLIGAWVMALFALGYFARVTVVAVAAGWATGDDLTNHIRAVDKWVGK